MDLAALDDHELLIATYQRFLLHEARDGVAPVVTDVYAVILPDDGEDDLFFNELNEGSNAEEADCFQLPAGAQAQLAGTSLELDLGGIQGRPAGPLGFPNDVCIRPQATLNDVATDTWVEDEVLDLTFTTSASTWSLNVDNPTVERRLERADDEPVLEGGDVTFVWSNERETPVFRDYRRGGTSAFSEVRLEQAGVPDVETLATWDGHELTIDLPAGTTGAVTVHIDYTYSEETETTYSGGSAGPSLALDRVLDDCPAARCRLQAGVTVAPLHFEIEPTP